MLAFFVVFIFNLLSLPQNLTFLKFNTFKFNRGFKSLNLLNLKYRGPHKTNVLKGKRESQAKVQHFVFFTKNTSCISLCFRVVVRLTGFEPARDCSH